MMKTSLSGRSLIEASEGKHYAVYFDGAGKPTTGIGHLLKEGEYEPGQTFTESQIQAWFDEDLAEAERIIHYHIKGPITQGQFDALVSFAFNFGAEKFSSYSLKDLINDKADEDKIANKWMQYVYTINDRDGDGEKDALIDRGLPIRRLRELLMFRGFSWEVAEAAVNANNITIKEEKIPWRSGFKEIMTNVSEFVNEAIERARSFAAFMDEPDDYLFKADPEHDAEAFHNDPDLQTPTRGKDVKPITDPTPETPLTTSDLNVMSQESLATGRPIDYGVPMTKLTKKVPVESVHYLSDADKKNITVKPIEDSKRGKGYAKTEQGKQQIIVGAGGTAAVAIGAAEPVVKFVDKYSFNTIAIVFLGLTVLGIITYYWGVWQREKGEDEAEDLLG